METPEIFETQDGSHSIFSPSLGVSYHSRYGAIQESRHVFIEAGLYYKALSQPEISILEIGLGTGLNVLLSFLEAARLQLKLYYEAVEAFPLSLEQISALNYPERLETPELRERLLSIHNCPWEETQEWSSGFQFRKKKALFQDIQYEPRFDLVYFDAFAPDAQPELWDLPVLSKVVDAMKAGAALVTYCAKGEVKRKFRKLGLTVESLPGPPGKREMTRGLKLV